MTQSGLACPDPKCGGSLAALETGELVTVEFCGGCNGIWFDAGETAAWMEMAADLPDVEGSLAAAKPSGMDCPKCGASFQEVPYQPASAATAGAGAGVALDRCSGCASLWFNAGEVPRVEKIAAQIGNPKSKVMRAFLQLAESGYEVIATQTR